MASVLSDILGDMTEDEVYEIITGDTSLQKLKKYVDDEKVAKIREEMAKGGEWMSSNHGPSDRGDGKAVLSDGSIRFACDRQYK